MKNRMSTDNVIWLTGRRPPASGARREVETYWTALADGRLMPRRAEVDPRGLLGALDRTFILEQVAPGHARFRVAGSRLGDLLGMDLRGMPMSALFHPVARPALADALRALFQEPARLSFRLDGAGGLLRRQARADCLLLPLRDDAGQVTRAIGCLDWDADRAPPHRFRILDEHRRTLIGYGERPLPPRPPGGHEKGPGASRPTLTLVP